MMSQIYQDNFLNEYYFLEKSMMSPKRRDYYLKILLTLDSVSFKPRKRKPIKEQKETIKEF